MAFTLISVSQLDKAGFLVTFNKAMCTIKTPKGKSIATIPCKDGLYKILAVQSKTPNESATVASAKMSISEAHRKLGHIAHSAVKHAITNGLIMGIQLDTKTKPKFCEAYAKAKFAWQPFPKESKTEWRVLVKECTGTCGDKPQSKVLMDIVTWQLILTMQPMKQNYISKKRRVRPLIPTNKTRLTSKIKPNIE